MADQNSWSRNGDTCPKCSSADTFVSVDRERVIIPTMGGFAQKIVDPHYMMNCSACGHTERKEGDFTL